MNVNKTLILFEWYEHLQEVFPTLFPSTFFSPIKIELRKKLQAVKLGVLKSFYKDQTRKKSKHEIFEGKFRTLNKKFSTINSFDGFRYVSNFFKTKRWDFLSIRGSVRWKIGKNEPIFTIFDSKSSVSWLIPMKMIKYMDYHVLLIWRGRNHSNYTIWNIFHLIRRWKFTF